MPKSTTFRVFGGLIADSRAYVDMNVGGIDNEGNIYLEEASGSPSDSHSFTPDEFRERARDGLILDRNSMPKTDRSMWKAVDKLGEERVSVEPGSDVDRQLETAIKSVFRAAAVDS